MASLDSSNGKLVDGINEVLQSVRTILQTRKGTRVFNREFGSDVPNYIDYSLSDETLLLIYAATLDAVTRLEPRFLPRNVTTNIDNKTGRLNITLTGVFENIEVELDAIAIG